MANLDYGYTRRKSGDSMSNPIEEWYDGTCEVCRKQKNLHIGYGQCSACIFGAYDEEGNEIQ
jgi:hypothetical protein